MAKLPKERDYGMDAVPAEQPKEVKPTVFLRIPAKEMDGIKIGDVVTATFRGKVVGIDIHESLKGEDSGHLDLKDPSVTVENTENQIESLDEELDE